MFLASEWEGNRTIFKDSTYITREEKQNLIQEFGAEITEEYIRRTSEYHCCNPETIRKWITKDQKKHKRNWNAFTSFPQRNYDQNVMDALERYLLRDDRKDTKKDINYKWVNTKYCTK